MALGRENPGNRIRRVLHDRAGPEAFAARQRRFRAARRSIARHVDRPLSRQARKTRFRSATSPTACTCPPGWRRRCSASTTATWAPAGTSTAANRASGKESRTSTTASCGKRTGALKSRLLEFVRRRAVEQAAAARRIARNFAKAQPRAQPGRADHRICAPLRHLQARQPDPGRYREAGVHGERSQASRAVRLRRQGASARRTRQARAAADRGADARSAIRRQVRLRRRLRHQRRAPLRAGRGRVAEQSAAAARSLRHQRPEGGA